MNLCTHDQCTMMIRPPRLSARTLCASGGSTFFFRLPCLRLNVKSNKQRVRCLRMMKVHDCRGHRCALRAFLSDCSTVCALRNCAWYKSKHGVDYPCFEEAQLFFDLGYHLSLLGLFSYFPPTSEPSDLVILAPPADKLKALL